MLWPSMRYTPKRFSANALKLRSETKPDRGQDRAVYIEYSLVLTFYHPLSRLSTFCNSISKWHEHCEPST